MPSYVEVLIPGPWWNSLSYVCDSRPPAEGARVRVPVGKGQRVGFFSGAASSAPPKEVGIIKKILEVLDDESVLGGELWNLAGWIGKTFLCGMGEALQLICPQPLLRGEPLFKDKQPFVSPAFDTSNFSGFPEAARSGEFRELSFYHPLDGERFAYYREILSSAAGRVLVLFPERQSASSFFAG
ncbi:MAG: hypothetical protein LBR71_02215, partial [Synergistaceae bacterium]|nr:hypothetical protein [Synergistaceae bacterium]